MIATYICVLDAKYECHGYTENVEYHELRRDKRTGRLGKRLLSALPRYISEEMGEYKKFPVTRVKIIELRSATGGAYGYNCWVDFKDFYELIVKSSTLLKKGKKKVTYKELLGLTRFQKNIFDTMESLMYNNNHEQNSVA
ncbi:MAG: hypothetical protein KBT06_04315 [Prevotellaceae bacterium]|nr:hypothetical protein [Candidatus Colivivens equi]